MNATTSQNQASHRNYNDDGSPTVHAKLERMGGKEWVKGDMHRYYFGAGSILRNILYVHIISSNGSFVKAWEENVRLRSHDISEEAAMKLLEQAKGVNFFYDVKARQFVASRAEDWFVQKLLSRARELYLYLDSRMNLYAD